MKKNTRMGRCGEDAFFDMTLGNCAHCDIICHTRQGNTDLDKCEHYCKGFLSKHPEIMDHINRNYPIKTTLHQQHNLAQHNPLLSTTTTGTSEQFSDLTVVAVISVILVLLSLGVLQFVLVMVKRKKLGNHNVEESNVNIVNGISDGSDGTDMHSINVHSDVGLSENCEGQMKKHHLSDNSECSASSGIALLQTLVDKQSTEHQERIFERQLSTISSRSDTSELVVIETESAELYPCPSSFAVHSGAVTVVISYNP